MAKPKMGQTIGSFSAYPALYAGGSYSSKAFTEITCMNSLKGNQASSVNWMYYRLVLSVIVVAIPPNSTPICLIPLSWPTMGAEAHHIQALTIRDYSILIPLSGHEESETLLDLATGLAGTQAGVALVFNHTANEAQELRLREKLHQYIPSPG